MKLNVEKELLPGNKRLGVLVEFPLASDEVVGLSPAGKTFL
jgi:hypothetical protein